MGSIRKPSQHAAMLATLMLGILPALKLGNVAVPVQYLLSPVFFFILVFVLFGWIKVSLAVIKWLFVLWLIIILEVIISGLFGPPFKSGVFAFPRDAFQYIVRFLFFLFFFVYFYKSDGVGDKKFIKYFLFVLLIGMMVGILQWLPWSGAGHIAEAYTFAEKHVKLSTVDLVFKRVPGIAGFATANGGIAAFTFIFALSSYCFLMNYRMLSLAAMLFAIWNTLASQARMGYLTIAFSVVVFYFIWIYMRRRFIRPSAYLLGGAGSLFLFVLLLYRQGNAFIVQAASRWRILGDQIHEGGNRIEQVVLSLSKLDGFYDYIFGISRFVQQSFGDLYIEVEPINILVMYGIAGVILQYALVLTLLIYFLMQLKHVRSYPTLSTLTVASFISLISYQFFSLAYFFFREVYVGLFPWILMGATIGMVEKHKRESAKNALAVLKTKGELQ
jgi:hypothetical protein